VTLRERLRALAGAAPPHATGSGGGVSVGATEAQTAGAIPSAVERRKEADDLIATQEM